MSESLPLTCLEQRQIPRIPGAPGTVVTLHFPPLAPDETILSLQGLVTDFSLNGCGVLCITRQVPLLYQHCTVAIQHRQPYPGQVVWIHDLDTHVVRLGIKFCNENELEASPEHWLAKDGRDILRGCMLFEGVDGETLNALWPYFITQTFQKDEVLIYPGHRNNHLYLVLSGYLRVSLIDIHNDQRDQDLQITIAPGECIGEMSIIENRPVSAYVVAETDGTLVKIPEPLFWERLIYIPKVTKNLLQELSSRIRRTDSILLKNLEERLKFEQIERDLQSASEIQANILPRLPVLPHHPQVDLFALVRPAKMVGGDFFDAFEIDEHHVCVAVGDVSGKGIPAALFMIRAITLLRLMLSPMKALDTALLQINNCLCQNNENHMFVTLFVGILDTRCGELLYANCGHLAPFLQSSEDPDQAFKPIPLPKGAMLGIMENYQFQLSTLCLKPGDTLVVYTDGVTEAENSQQDLFQEYRAIAYLNGLIPLPAVEDIVHQLEDCVLNFSGEMLQADDITIMALRYWGNEVPEGGVVKGQ